MQHKSRCTFTFISLNVLTTTAATTEFIETFNNLPHILNISLKNDVKKSYVS